MATIAVVGVSILGVVAVGVGVTAVVVGVGVTAVVGTAVVVGGVTATHELYKARKEQKKQKKSRDKQWKVNFIASHPECNKRKYPKVPKHVGPQLNLSEIQGYSIGLGWDSKEPTNADLVAVAFDREGKILGGVSGAQGNQIYESPALLHSGDCREGGKESRESGHYDDNENIIMNFGALPEEVSTIVLGVFYDCESGEKTIQDFRDSYVNGLPIYQFMSAEEFVLQKQAIEEKEKVLQKQFIDLRKKDEDEDSNAAYPEMSVDNTAGDEEESESEAEPCVSGEKEEPELPEEETPIHSFTCSIGKLGDCNAFIPGKFAKLNGTWVYKPIQVPVKVSDIDEFGSVMSPFTPSSVTIPKWGSREFTFSVTDVCPDDYDITVVAYDRWNYSQKHHSRNITPSFDTFLGFNWKTEPKPFEYVLAMASDESKRITCQNDSCAESQILCRISRSRAHQKGDYQLPYSKDCNLEFLHKAISKSDDAEATIKEKFSIGSQVKLLKVTVARGYDLAAKDLNGKSDPYVKVTSSKKRVKGSAKSSTVKKDLNPIWNFAFTMETAAAESSKFKLTIWDKDALSDDKIGVYSLNVNKICIPFEEPVLLKGKGRCGAIAVKVEPCIDPIEKNHFSMK